MTSMDSVTVRDLRNKGGEVLDRWSAANASSSRGMGVQSLSCVRYRAAAPDLPSSSSVGSVCLGSTLTRYEPTSTL